MSFGNFIRGIVAQVNPFDNGKTYGSYNPPKRKPQPGDPGYQAPQSSQAPSQNQPQLSVQRPENLFAGLNQNLKLPGSPPQNNVTVVHAPNLTSLTPPNPGTVVQPQQPLQVHVAAPQNLQVGNQTIAPNPQARTGVQPPPPSQPVVAPHPSFWSSAGNDIKTAAQTAAGTAANIPEVGLAAARAGTGIVQGVTQIPHIVTATAATGTQALQQHMNNPFTRQLNRGAQDINTGIKTASNVIDAPINAANRGLDTAASAYANHVPMADAGAQVYRREQIPLNALAVLATLGGSGASEVGANAGRLSRIGDKISSVLNTPLTSNADNVIAKTGQAVTDKTAPVVNALSTPIKTARAGVSRLINGPTVPTAAREAVDTGEIGNVLSEPQIQDLTQPSTQVPVTQQGGSVPIPVGIPRPGPAIRELGGDTPGRVQVPTPGEAIAQRAKNAFDNQPVPRPAQNIEGVTPRAPEKPLALDPAAVANAQNQTVNSYADMLRNMGESNGVAITSDGRRVSNNVRPGDTGGKRMTQAMWREEAQRQLEAGKAEPGHQQAFNDAANPGVQSLLTKSEPLPAGGQPISVKQVKGIDVVDKTEVPQNLPETPGQVRVTDQNSPVATKTEAVASAPVVAPPAALPKETQAILDSPKQFSKRQVAAARNQRKLATQLAKTKADTQAVIDGAPKLPGFHAEDIAIGKNADGSPIIEPGMNPAVKPEGNPGFVSTGEFRKGANGNVSEVAHGSTEAAQAASDTANLSSGDVLAKAQQDIAQGGRVSPESVRNLQSMLESGRFSQTSPEYRAIAKTLYGAGSDYGRGLSLFDPTMRRTATGDQLTNRFVSKLYGVAEDGSKLTEAHVAAVSNADNAFTGARDAANQALDRYNATKSSADFSAWKQAQQTAEDAERQALITEYKVANEVLKGNKDPNAIKAVQDAEKKAGVYQMDWIDSNMLSGTGTFARNFANTSLVRMENRLFGGRGYSSKGAKLGNAVGNRNLVTDFNARNHLDQNIVSKTIKQWSTTGNMLGESHISAVANARAYKFYENQLKAQGVTGDQLARDTEVRLHTDPDEMAKHYEQWALSENALSSMSHNNKKLEQSLVDTMSGVLGNSKMAQLTSKALVRMTVGFPTVIGRSLLGGAKRAALGLPELGMAGRALAKGDKQMAADLLYSAKVHAGSGAALYGLGTVLASAGLISPSYPSDKAEQARWKEQGIQPNSIKIGGSWFGIPGYFGALALPLVIPANVMGKSNPADVAQGIVSGLQDLSPTTGLINFVNGMEGRSGKQWVKDEVTSLTRAVTPVGALLNEIAKMTDPTKNDTTTKDAISNLLDNIASGIPGVNNAVNKIPATDANGNVLHNPNPVATALGAQGAVQPQGAQDVKQAQGASDQTYQQLQKYGVTQDKNLTQLIDKKLLAQIQRGQPLKPEDVKKVQNSVTKGVSATEDNNWRQNGQYSTDKAALQVKLQMLEADPTSKPSEKDAIKTQIARDGVLATNKIPYSDLKLYESTSSGDWHSMGDPKSENYDPATYQKLWSLDQMFAKAGASYNSKDTTQQKFKAKAAGSGSGGSRGYSADFGKLTAGNNAPSVQQYQSIGAKSGIIPHISVQRPNIVHRISSSGGI